MKKHTLPQWSVWLLGLLGVLCIGLVCLMLQIGSVTATLRVFIHEPILFLLNFWPIAAVLLVTVLLFNNLFYGCSFTTFLWGILSYVNLIKTSSRGDPFVPGDVLLLTEGIEAVGNYSLDLHLGKLIPLLILCAALLAAGIFFKNPKLRWSVRGIGSACIAAVFALTMFTVYPDKDLYEGLQGPPRFNVPAVFDGFGFPYCFLHNFNLYPIECPDGYNSSQAANYESEFQAGNLPIKNQEHPEIAGKPNVLMVMCEAFCDLSNLDSFSWADGENPIEEFNLLAEDPNNMSGHMVVSNTGAGTANTEFDILTGCMTNKLSPATTSAFRVVHRNTPSLPRAFETAGYNTLFMHPGESWFYNRESVYSYLGITDTIFKNFPGYFTQDDMQGGWITDQAFLRELTKALDARHSQGPLFTYGVTIQNHQAYNYNKYPFTPPMPQTDLELSDAAKMYLSVYFQGAKDGSVMLKQLTEYLNAQQEPYVLFFYGDHQPNLGASFLAFEELGLNYTSPTTTEEKVAMYTVPYIIWTNDAYREANGSVAELCSSMGLDKGSTISSHYLGSVAYELAGLTGTDGYYDYLDSMRRNLPVCSVYGYQTADGSWYDSLPDPEAEMENIRWYWQYYRLKQQKA